MLAVVSPSAAEVARAGEPKAAASDDAVVATVNGVPIGAAAVRQQMIRKGADFLPRFKKMVEKESVVDELVRIQVLSQAAREASYADDPEIIDSLNRLIAEKFWRDSLAKQPLPPVTKEEARAYYDAHLEEFIAPQRARGALIFLRWPPKATDSQRNERRAEAKRLRGEAEERDGLGFDALVAAHSDAPDARRNGGDTGFVTQGATVFRVPPTVVEALFAVEEVGGVTPVIETDRGLYIARLTAREGGAVPDFDLVERDIRGRLHEERTRARREALYAEIREGFRITVDRKVLETIGPNQLSAGARPPSFPVGDATP